MKLRRLSALVALLALSRLSLSGAAGACDLPSDATDHHGHTSAAATAAAAHDHDAADEQGSESDCANAQHDSCPSMSSCANAVLPEAWVSAPDICSAQRVVAGVSERAIELLRAPEPPPPRA